MNRRPLLYERIALPLSYIGKFLTIPETIFYLTHNQERVTGVEPVSHPWEGCILPLNHTRNIINYNSDLIINQFLPILNLSQYTDCFKLVDQKQSSTFQSLKSLPETFFKCYNLLMKDLISHNKQGRFDRKFLSLSIASIFLFIAILLINQQNPQTTALPIFVTAIVALNFVLAFSINFKETFSANLILNFNIIIEILTLLFIKIMISR